MANRGDIVNIHAPEGHNVLGIVTAVPAEPGDENLLTIYQFVAPWVAADAIDIPERGKRAAVADYGWEPLTAPATSTASTTEAGTSSTLGTGQTSIYPADSLGTPTGALTIDPSPRQASGTLKSSTANG